jgi:hypothetical protein
MKTVWEFRSIDGKQVDLKFQHEYQRVLYRGGDPTLIAQALAQ